MRQRQRLPGWLASSPTKKADEVVTTPLPLVSAFLARSWSVHLPPGRVSSVVPGVTAAGAMVTGLPPEVRATAS